MKPAPLVLPILLLSQAVYKPAHSAAPTLAQIVKEARENEAKLQTGAVRLSEVTTHTPQTDAEVEAIYGNSAGARQIERETPRQIKGTRTLLFDNRKSALLVENRDDHQTLGLRVVFDKTVTKSWRKSRPDRASGKVSVPECNISIPIPTLNNYNALLTGRFWRDTKFANAELRAVSASAAWVELPERFGQQTVLELDPRQNYAVKTLRVVDAKTGRLSSQMRITRRQQNGIWFPAKITQITYNVGAATDNKVIDTTETVIQSADLNLPLTERDLAFGPIPFGAVVTDARFHPPLTYNQGVRQFTDAELKVFSINPNALTRGTVYTPAEFARLQKELEAQKARP